MPWIKSRGKEHSHKIFKKMTVYSMRLGKDGMKDSAPCFNCFNCMRSLGIKRIVYSENNKLISTKLKSFSTNYSTTGNRHTFTDNRCLVCPEP